MVTSQSHSAHKVSSGVPLPVSLCPVCTTSKPLPQALACFGAVRLICILGQGQNRGRG